MHYIYHRTKLPMQSLFRTISCSLFCLSFYSGNSQNRDPIEADTGSTAIFATLDSLNKAIKADPLNSSAYARRASFRRLTMKDLKGSVADCNSSLLLNPKASDLYCLRASNELELHMFSESLQDIDHALKTDSTNSEAYWLRGNFEQLNNQLFAAGSDFNLASHFQPQENKYSIQTE
jgi:hypothetical protein